MSKVAVLHTNTVFTKDKSLIQGVRLGIAALRKYQWRIAVYTPIHFGSESEIRDLLTEHAIDHDNVLDLMPDGYGLLADARALGWGGWAKSVVDIVARSTGYDPALVNTDVQVNCKCNDYQRLVRHIRPYIDLLASNAARIGGGAQAQEAKQHAANAGTLARQLKERLGNVEPVDAEELAQNISLEDVEALELRVIYPDDYEKLVSLLEDLANQAAAYLKKAEVDTSDLMNAAICAFERMHEKSELL